MEMTRLDLLLVLPSSARARDAIRRGTVRVDGQIAEKPGMLVASGAAIAVDDPAQEFVSRGALKLTHALDHFDLSPQGADASISGRRPAASPKCCCGAGTIGQRHRCRPWAARNGAGGGPARQGAVGCQCPRLDGRSSGDPARFHRRRCQLHLAEIGAAGAQAGAAAMHSRGSGQTAIRAGRALSKGGDRTRSGGSAGVRRPRWFGDDGGRDFGTIGRALADQRRRRQSGVLPPRGGRQRD